MKLDYLSWKVSLVVRAEFEYVERIEFLEWSALTVERLERLVDDCDEVLRNPEATKGWKSEAAIQRRKAFTYLEAHSGELPANRVEPMKPMKYEWPYAEFDPSLRESCGCSTCVTGIPPSY